MDLEPICQTAHHPKHKTPITLKVHTLPGVGLGTASSVHDAESASLSGLTPNDIFQP